MSHTRRRRYIAAANGNYENNENNDRLWQMY